ncbi:MAG: glycosyltransferase family 9 protein [Ignavibacteria bacterium]|nr:glycosyltransferase family 9 protein [Ignavibacteria bacterium]
MKTKILIIQTAFIGDVILTLPVVQVLKKQMECELDFLCIPKTADLLKNNRYVDNIIIYDKRARDRGIKKLLRLSNRIRFKKYDIIISPHRSARSTFIAYRGKSEMSISYDISTFSFLYNKTVKYIKNIHEIRRNLKLLVPLGIYEDSIIKPEIFCSESDGKVVSLLLKKYIISEGDRFVTFSPGTVWMTKRYPPDKFIRLLDLLTDKNFKVILIGGKEDIEICRFIKEKTINQDVFNSAGKLTLTQSAELLRRSSLLVTNDSSPLHLANSVGTKVIAIYGATIPEFGFYPYGKNDKIFQVNGLKCRPCSIHGLNKCPVKTLDCLERIREEEIAEEILKSISSSHQELS